MGETGLPPNWTIRVSRTHNREYFYNQSTKDSSWEFPFGTDNAKLQLYLSKFKQNGNRPVVAEDGKIRVTHILIKHKQSRRPSSWKSPDGITITRDEAIVSLKKLQKKILDGEAKIGEFAQTESDDSSHTTAGDIGYFKKGQMQPSFEEAAFSLHVGELSDLVETDSGIHLIQRVA